jgi:protease I
MDYRARLRTIPILFFVISILLASCQSAKAAEPQIIHVTATPMPSPTPIPPTPTPAPTSNRLSEQHALIVIFQSFEDYEFKYPYLALYNESAKITIAGPYVGAYTGMHGRQVETDIKLADVVTTDYDAIIFIGGSGVNAYDKDAIRISQEAVENNIIISAICFAPLILANADVISGKTISSSLDAYSFEQKGATYNWRSVSRDGNMITANGPNAAVEFGRTIVEALLEKQ